ncbi:unnamed protein product, partial [Lymnaea stagnalis]
SSTCSPRPPPNDKVWVIASPFSPPPPGNQGLALGSRPPPGFLSELSLHSTPVDAGGPPAGHPHTRASYPGTSQLSANDLHDSVLSALSHGAGPEGFDDVSPKKSSLERKVSSKRKPSGTFEYKVKDGDTLVKIAAHFDVTPSELININKILSRTVFVGQTLFIPDPAYVPSDPPTPRSASPAPDTRPKVDVPLVNLADRPMPSIPGHAVPVSSQPMASSRDALVRSPKERQLPKQTSHAEQETDKECMQKFVKGPARRIMEDEEEDGSNTVNEIVIKGTLLVTPNAIMFDPDASDPEIINHQEPDKFGMVVYMDQLKSMALFHDFSPRMFWRQPKEIRAHSPKPEPYRLSQGKRPTADGQAEQASEQMAKPSPLAAIDHRPAPDGASIEDDVGQQRAPPDGGDPTEKTSTGRTSEELEGLSELHRLPDSPPQQGRASEEVENALTQGQNNTDNCPLVKQMSRSSELEVSEMALLQDSPDGIGETRDFGPHMGRSSSEVHRQTTSSLGRISDSSPGDTTGRSFFAEPGDTTSDSLSTPTHGFAPLHFTDRSPKSVLAHPKPVPGQRGIQLSQPPAQSNDLKSQRILEDTEVNLSDFQSSGHHRVSPSLTAQTSGGVNPTVMLSDGQQRASSPASDTGSSSGPSSAVGDSEVKTAAEQAAVEGSVQPRGTTSELQSQDDIDEEITQLSSRVAGLGVNQKQDIQLGAAKPVSDSASKPSTSSPRSTFAPLLAPAQQLTSIFKSTYSVLTSFDGRARTKSNPIIPTTSSGLQLRSGFSKEELHKALGPDPKDFLPRSDSPHFEQPPLYLQIRPGIKKSSEFGQPRAFDHRNHKLLDEYWLIVPREMGDKLYGFLMEWQPEVYGDEEETGAREKFFYDVKEVQDRIKPVKKAQEETSEKAGGDVELNLDDSHFKEVEKSWEILSKEEVYCAEKSQSLCREDTIDESNFPELVGQTQIIEPYHVLSLIRSLPRNMTAGYNWELTYATHKHGYSLQNLYQKMECVDDSPVLLFIRDIHKCVFGAFLSHLMRPSENFYGSGSCFLFTFYPDYKKYFWQGDNQFFMYGTKDSFAIGSGEGVFGLWLDSDLNKGRSHECTTFHNDILTKDEDFTITDLEVWRFVE